MSATWKAIQDRYFGQANPESNEEVQDQTILPPSKIDEILLDEEVNAPAIQAFFHAFTKEHRGTPPLIHHFPNIASLAAGNIMMDSVGFPYHSLQIDNYSNVWLYVGNMWFVQPWVTGVQIPFPKGETTVRVEGAAPPGFTQPALTANTTINVVAREALCEYSPGLGIPAGSHP